MMSLEDYTGELSDVALQKFVMRAACGDSSRDSRSCCSRYWNFYLEFRYP